MSMPTYIGRDGELKRAWNTLDPAREQELRAHLRQCETALQQCHECWLLYCSVGQEEYTRILTEGME